MRAFRLLGMAILISAGSSAAGMAQTAAVEVTPDIEVESIDIPADEVDLAAAAAALADYRQAADSYRQDLVRLDRSAPEFRTAAEGLARSLQGVGLCHYLMGQNQEALAVYDEAAKVSTDYLGTVDEDLLWKRAQAYEQAGDHQRVVTDLEPLLKTSRNPNLLYTLARSYRELKRYGEAASLFEEVVKARPDDDNALFLLAHTYSSQGKYEEAAEAYRKAIDLTPADDVHTLESLYLNLGIAYKQLCRKTEAREAYLKAAEINQQHRERLAHLAFYRCKSPKRR